LVQNLWTQFGGSTGRGGVGGELAFCWMHNLEYKNSGVRIQERGERKRPDGPRLYLERAPARTFRDLVVWQLAHQFVLSV
jgi:hypothetical protein